MMLELVFLDNLPINVNVILSHSGEGEVLLDMAAARAPVDRIELLQRGDHAIQGIYQKAGFSVYHNFRQGAPLHRQNGGSRRSAKSRMRTSAAPASRPEISQQGINFVSASIATQVQTSP